MTRKLTGWGALALLAIAIIWLAVSPYWTLSVLKTAVDERNAAVINERTISPSVTLPPKVVHPPSP